MTVWGNLRDTILSERSLKSGDEKKGEVWAVRKW